MQIEVKDLSYTYNPKSPFAKQALNGVNLSVEKGEMLAIIGHTGSGKSTFVQHLNGLIKVQSGSVIVNGIDLTAKKPDFTSLRKEVGMVFQYPEYQLFADTVAIDVAFGPKNAKMEKEEIDRRVKEAIEMVGLDYNLTAQKSPFDLSGGERRRAALAGVLATNPGILILDEPTAGLDPQGKGQILSIVRQLNKQKGVTVIMVSHDMNEIYENADRVVLFEEGKVLGDAATQEMFDGREIKGLELPAMAVIKNLLREKGQDIKGLKVKDVAQSIIDIYNKRRKGNV